MAAEVSRLVLVDPRVVWPNEAADFTPWLRDNADALADALGLDLELTVTEHQVGPFYLDVLGRDVTNDNVLVVENQLTPTDHDHLGKLVTYAANTDAATVVWMALSFREEHRQALVFLNELGGEKARFFGVEIGAVRIGDSAPAPLFKVVAQPNDFHAAASRAASESSEAPSEKRALYAQFWERFLEQLKIRHPDWSRATKGPRDNWLSLPSRFGGLSYYCVSFPSKQRLRCELYLDWPDPSEVQARYGALYEHREEIEAGLDADLSWDATESRRGARVAIYGSGTVEEVDRHEEFIEWFLANLERLRTALDPYVL